ncbi:MAG: type II toxin-antitoxin system VapC family toxin [Vicinamibacteria bacterium]
MRVLLDTNAYTALFRGHTEVARIVRQSEEVLFSPIVAGELLFGFRNGTRYEANRREMDAFLDNPFVRKLELTMVTADRFGRLAAALRKKGRPVPSNDLWIAAQAMETGADLLSFDRHFAEIDGLAWVLPEE